jgi:putative oxidoreductase
LSLLRSVSGLLFLEHGLQKILHFPPSSMAGAMGGHPPWFLAPAGYIELIGGALLLIGLLTRVAAFICSGEMAFAYFIAHAPRSPFPANNQGDAAILFCFVFFFIIFAGSGAISVDAVLFKKKMI